MKSSNSDAQLAAGALVWRIGESGGLEVLAVHRPRYDDWSWPKGKLDPGETLPACAVREVAEETGQVIELGIPLPTLRYPIGGGRMKVVRYWAAQAIAKDVPAVAARDKVKPASKHEIDEQRWLPVEEARHLITFHDDLRPLERLVEAYEQGRLKTRTFVVVRHARARRRKGWEGPDLRRPITGGGRKRAEELRALIAAYGIERASSSPALRCIQTINPFAQAAGIPVRGYNSLTEPSHAEDPAATAATLTKLLRKQRNRVICVHRPTLPTIVKVLRSHLTTRTRGALPRTNPFLPAGGVLVAHLIDGLQGPEIVAVETHLLKPGL